MSNTLKFGNGNWATKEGSTLAYNDLNSNYKPLPFDFTRASIGTVINKDGLIEEVGSGEPRIDYLDNTAGSLLLEPQRTNLITQSEAFGNSYWTKSGAIIQGDASTAGSELILSTMINTSYSTFDGASSSGFHAINSANVSQRAGTVDEINFVTGKTYRVNIDVSVVSGNAPFFRARQAIATSPVLYSGQLVDGSNIITFTSSETLTGLLEFSNSTSTEYTISNVSVKEVQGFASPSADSPLGAFKLVEDTSNAKHRVFTSLVGTSETFSFFAKADGRNWVSVLSNNGNSSFFDIGNGVVGTVTEGSIGKIESLIGGWCRCTLYNSHGTFGAYIGLAESNNSETYQGDGTSGVYIYGAQLEAASYPTSYIKTEGSTVTRLADSCNNENLNVDYSGDYTLYLEHEALSITEYNQFQFRQETSISYIFRVGNSINIGSGLYTTVNTIGFNKFALSVTSTGLYNFYKNGVLLSSGSGLNANLETLKSDAIGMNIKEIKLYNTALSNSELQALTRV